MHPHEGAWRAWLDDESPSLVRRELDRHLTECRECREQVESLRNLRTTASDLLALLDGPVPMRNVEAVLARAARRPSRRWILLAAAITAIVVTAASATIQGVVFHRLTAALQSVGIWPLPPSAPASSELATTVPNSVSTVPSDSIEIVFLGGEDSGADLSIRLGDGPAVTVAATAEVAYSVGSDRITVTSASRGTDFIVLMPRASKRVVVRIAGAVVFAKAGTVITTVARRDAAGYYSLSMTQSGGRLK